MIVERHVSPDGLLTLLVDLTADDWTVGFEGYPWHTHGDILSAWGHTGSPGEAVRAFVADVVASRKPIVVAEVNGVITDVQVPAEYHPVELADGLAKYGVPGETADARYWDGRPAGLSHPFVIVPSSQLSERHFVLFPIWSEYYDFEERDEIASWGVDRTWLDQELERLRRIGEDCVYPVLRTTPFPVRMRLFIKARFLTVGGSRLNGYVMNEDAFTVTVFAGNGEYTFSRNDLMAALNTASGRGLREAMQAAVDPIFPLQYETGVVGTEAQPIAGKFTPGGFDTSVQAGP